MAEIIKRETLKADTGYSTAGQIELLLNRATGSEGIVCMLAGEDCLLCFPFHIGVRSREYVLFCIWFHHQANETF